MIAHHFLVLVVKGTAECAAPGAAPPGAGAIHHQSNEAASVEGLVALRLAQGRDDAARKRFRSQPPKLSFHYGQDRVQMWDADDFDPWETLRWPTVRVFLYRQHKPNGAVVEAFWLTNLSTGKAGTRFLFQLAKSRWEIENQGFNDAKNRYGMEPICHHHPNSLLTGWLLLALGLTIERLYRIRYLHRGDHPLRTAIELLRILWFHLAVPSTADTS